MHIDDLAGHLDQHEEWVVLRLPAIAETDEIIPIGLGQVHLRKAGDVLHPEREPLLVLQSVERACGSVTYSAQYQKRLVPADGEVVRWAWFQRYSEPPPSAQMIIHQSWDTASKPDEHHEFSVCTTWGAIQDRLHPLDVDQARLDFPTLKRRVIEMAWQWKARTILIEDKGSGTSLIQQLRFEYNGIPYPVAFMPKEDKITRLHAASARIEAGHVWVPDHASWLGDF